MSTPSNTIPESFGRSAARESRLRPWYWSVRRELWEYRSLYLAPLIVAGVIVVATTLSRIASIWEPAIRTHAGESIASSYNMAAMMLMGTTFLVSLFYCADALHGERRDRSVLFWKSLPVSDETTVLAKFSIPLLVIPLITFVITLGTQWVMLIMHTLIRAAIGGDVGEIWRMPLLEMWVMQAYHLIFVHGLWYAPFYAWLLLVSAWAKRAPILWALIPIAAVGIVEAFVFRGNWFLILLERRLMGGPAGDYAGDVLMPPLSQLTPLKFLMSPGLWIGFGLAAVFLLAAVRLRRQRGPL